MIDGDLDLDARRALIASAIQLIERSHAPLEMDCSAVDAAEPIVLGMLVEIGRRAQWRGVRVVLVGLPAPLRARLDEQQLSDRFEIRS